MSAVVVQAVTDPRSGGRSQVLAPQVVGACPAIESGSGASAGPSSRRRLQGLSSMTVDATVDASQSTLSGAMTDAAGAVSTALSAALADPAQVDALFGPAVAAACAAQGIAAASCPRPPSLAVRLVSASAATSVTPRSDAGGSALSMLLTDANLVAAAVGVAIGVVAGWLLWVLTSRLCSTSKRVAVAAEPRQPPRVQSAVAGPAVNGYFVPPPTVVQLHSEGRPEPGQQPRVVWQ
jgi:hypothetical protein